MNSTLNTNYKRIPPYAISYFSFAKWGPHALRVLCVCYACPQGARNNFGKLRHLNFCLVMFFFFCFPLCQ